MFGTVCCVLLKLCWTCRADALDMYEAWHSSSYRQKAIDMIYEHVCADDTASHGISIGPVRASYTHSLIHLRTWMNFDVNTGLNTSNYVN